MQLDLLLLLGSGPYPAVPTVPGLPRLHGRDDVDDDAHEPPADPGGTERPSRRRPGEPGERTAHRAPRPTGGRESCGAERHHQGRLRRWRHRQSVSVLHLRKNSALACFQPIRCKVSGTDFAQQRPDLPKRIPGLVPGRGAEGYFEVVGAYHADPPRPAVRGAGEGQLGCER